MVQQLPNAHPQVKFGKTGVLLANLGTPDGTDYWSMRKYLGEFLSDKRVIDYSPWLWQPLLQLIILTKRPFSSGAAYKTIWNKEANESPLLTITKDQTHRLEKKLKTEFGDNVEIEFCMRYGNPSTELRLNSLIQKGCSKIIFLPLSESIKIAYKKANIKPEVLVSSYHGVPKRYLSQGDPYHCQCQKTTRLIREKLGWSNQDIITTFQSKFGPEEWLQPYTVKKVAELAKEGVKNIAVIAPAFSSDCIETLEEINEEIKESFMSAGGKNFTYIPCLNSSEPHIDFLKELISENGSGWL